MTLLVKSCLFRSHLDLSTPATCIELATCARTIGAVGSVMDASSWKGVATIAPGGDFLGTPYRLRRDHIHKLNKSFRVYESESGVRT
jgi:hypothetical protein